ncbi:hypothetical protein PINS_up004468 [Pythium insidiosum]|nr:hypothetical protein PINS_up004468 [Pythium insidiosum]
MSDQLWGEAYMHALHTINVTATKSLGGKTPHQALYDAIPDIPTCKDLTHRDGNLKFMERHTLTRDHAIYILQNAFADGDHRLPSDPEITPVKTTVDALILMSQHLPTTSIMAQAPTNLDTAQGPTMSGTAPTPTASSTAKTPTACSTKSDAVPRDPRSVPHNHREAMNSAHAAYRRAAEDDELESICQHGTWIEIPRSDVPPTHPVIT